MPFYLWPFAIVLGIFAAGLFLSLGLDEKKVEDYGKNVVLNHLIHYFGLGLLALFLFGPPADFTALFFDRNFGFLLSLGLGILCGLLVQGVAAYIYVISTDR